MTISLTLPFPVSVNAMYSSVKRGRKIIRIKSKRYSDWKMEASYQLARQYAGGLYGMPIMLQIGLCPKDNRCRDLDNHAKAIQDLLTGAIIQDDSQIKLLIMYWIDVEKQPYAKVQIDPIGSPNIEEFVSSFNALSLDYSVICATKCKTVQCVNTVTASNHNLVRRSG